MEKSNSFILKITGGAELSDKLDASQSFKISADLDCYSIEKRDNNDGSFDVIYKSKITSPIEVEQTGKKIQGKDKRRMSQRLRSLLYINWKDEGAIGEFEDFYNIEMEKVYSNWELIREFIKDK